MRAANRCINPLTILWLWLAVSLPIDANAIEQNKAENSVQPIENGDPESIAYGQWQLVKTDPKNNISVYYRRLSSGNIEFKGSTTIQSTLSSIIAVFLDLESMPQWLYRTQKVTLLERVEANELYIYTIHNMPFPFRNRDSANLIQLTQKPLTKIVTVNVRNAPDYVELNEDFVRVPAAVSTWQLLPLGNGQVEITFSGYGEPGGSISSDTYHSSLFQWLVKQFLWKVPYKSLLGLKEYAGREKYQNRKFDFIQELNDS